MAAIKQGYRMTVSTPSVDIPVSPGYSYVILVCSTGAAPEITAVANAGTSSEVTVSLLASSTLTDGAGVFQFQAPTEIVRVTPATSGSAVVPVFIEMHPVCIVSNATDSYV